MKFWLSLIHEPSELLLDHARNAEELGYEGVVVSDHVVIKDGERTPHPSGQPVPADRVWTDPLLTFSAMAAVTTRLRFLSYVYVVPLRDPFLLAKQAGTLAVISHDRFVLGTGVGWLREEFDTVGRDFTTRGKRMDEMLEILRDFWDDGYAEFHGEYFDFPRSGMFPVPNRQIPIWIGGHSTAAARRAAAYDGYMPMRALNDQTRAEYKLIDELREARGLTDPFERMTSCHGIGDAAAARKLEEADGITNMLVWPWTLGDHRQSFDEKRALAARFAETVIHQP